MSARLVTAAAVAWLVIGAASAVGAQGPEPLFESRCARCHGGADSLAQRRLLVADGVVQIQESGQDLRAFLSNHFEPLTEDEIELLHEAFREQLEASE